MNYALCPVLSKDYIEFIIMKNIHNKLMKK